MAIVERGELFEKRALALFDGFTPELLLTPLLGCCGLLGLPFEILAVGLGGALRRGIFSHRLELLTARLTDQHAHDVRKFEAEFFGLTLGP